MSAIIQNICVAGAQPFQVRVNGLNPGTKLTAFFDGNPISTSQIRQVVRTDRGVFSDQLYDVFGLNVISGELITDRNGGIEFIFYYNDSIGDNVTSEEAAYQYAASATGRKSLIVIDEASASSITQTLANIVGSSAKQEALRAAKCFAEAFINISYGITFKLVTQSIATSSGATVSGGGATVYLPQQGQDGPIGPSDGFSLTGENISTVTAIGGMVGSDNISDAVAIGDAAGAAVTASEGMVGASDSISFGDCSGY